jgi:hypothetical protein
VTTSIERDESSAVRSHISFDSQVDAVCHHSGRYLTWDEANHPIWKRLLTRLMREQHDFPGLRRLDRAFKSAAHSSQHQHVAWSRVAVQNLGLLLFGPVILYLVVATFEQQDFVPLVVWWVYVIGLLVLALAGVVLMGMAVVRYGRRDQLFHKRAVGQPPAITDYPVQGSYHIRATESVTINLDNVHKERPIVTAQKGELSVAVQPSDNDWENYQTYREQYAAHSVGEYVHAGAIALENLSHVNFLDETAEYDHRLVLRVPSSHITWQPEDKGFEPFTMNTAYEIRPSALYPRHNGLERFPLECEPRLSANDSRSLSLHFYWRGQDPDPTCRLEECILDIPDKLTPVTKVTFGRYDQEKQQVIWRNRSFRQDTLELKITFEKPVLDCREPIVGTYRFSYDGLLSRMMIMPERAWTALGRQVSADDVHIHRHTTVNGNLTLGLQRLSQEHEYVQPMPPIICEASPDEKMVEAVLNVLVEEGFDLQRVARAAPRLDPNGRLDKQLYYWDIIGRRYNEQLLDSLDVHVVITGSDSTAYASEANNSVPQTHIDLRVRCLHDPRNQSTPKSVDALVGREDEYSLAAKIRKVIGQI